VAPAGWGGSLARTVLLAAGFESIGSMDDAAEGVAGTGRGCVDDGSLAGDGTWLFGATGSQVRNSALVGGDTAGWLASGNNFVNAPGSAFCEVSPTLPGNGGVVSKAPPFPEPNNMVNSPGAAGCGMSIGLDEILEFPQAALHRTVPERSL